MKKSLQNMNNPLEGKTIDTGEAMTGRAVNALTGTPETPEATEKRGKGRPRNSDLIQDDTAQKGLTKDYTRTGFLIRVDTLEEFKNFAYTEHLKIKDALEIVMRSYLDQYKKEHTILKKDEDNKERLENLLRK